MLICSKIYVFIEGYGRKVFNLHENKISQNQWRIEVENNEFIAGNIDVFKKADSYIMKLDIECIPYPYDYYRSFESKTSVGLSFTINDSNYKGLGVKKYNPFWNKPVFWDKCQILQSEVQQLIIEQNRQYLHIMPLSNENLQCALSGTDLNELTLNVSTYCPGICRISGYFAVISTADNPHKAISRSYDAAYESNLIITPPRSNKNYPKELEGLGWCTWNAFYHDVTAEGIERKLNEFKEKSIPIKWIIIDDGWSQTDDFRLVSFFEDKNKFPEGLKKFVCKIKRKYGIQYVGVWHSFTGYWFGIKKGSYAEDVSIDILSENNSGIHLPSGEEEKAYQFYDMWHKYLKSQGIAFLKVDCQGNAFEFYKNTPDVYRKVINLHKALEKSVKENFGGSMINCMGMSNLDMYSRSISSVIRNSDDFYPDKEDGFESHIVQNVYNAVFNAYLYFCDFDMWWTNQPDSKRSSVLRAVSGGPIYISDKLGDTNDTYIRPLIDECGNIRRCTDSAIPTSDCLFTDPHDNVLKIFNRFEDDFVLAAFNLSDKIKKTEISLADMYICDENEYFCECCFSQKAQILSSNDVIDLEIEGNGVELLKLSRIIDGKVNHSSDSDKQAEALRNTF